MRKKRAKKMVRRTVTKKLSIKKPKKLIKKMVRKTETKMVRRERPEKMVIRMGEKKYSINRKFNNLSEKVNKLKKGF